MEHANLSGKSTLAKWVLGIAIVGAAACAASGILALVYEHSLRESLYWLASLLVCVSAIVQCRKKYKANMQRQNADDD